MALTQDSQADARNETAMWMVYKERQRQHQLKRDGRFKYTPSDNNIPFPVRLAMLVEEVGEVAREALAMEGIVQEQPDPDKRLKELVQVAAIAVALIEGDLEVI